MKNDDYFDRQKRIPGWNQDIVEKQVVLCLGVGGLGTNVAMHLCRLGVKKIFLIDKDIVDAHNLNRQILFSKKHIGTPKVDAAMDALLQQHNICTEIIPMHIDALTNWNKIVTVACECTVIFNMIDVGDYFDIAVQSLALKLNIAMVLGGTYQNTMTVDYIAAGGRPCWLCIGGVSDRELLKSLTPNLISSYEKIDFIPSDSKPIGASNIYVASTCSGLMVSHFIQALFDNAVPTRSIFYYLTYEIETWGKMEADSNCLLCLNR